MCERGAQGVRGKGEVGAFQLQLTSLFSSAESPCGMVTSTSANCLANRRLLVAVASIGPRDARRGRNNVTSAALLSTLLRNLNEARMDLGLRVSVRLFLTHPMVPVSYTHLTLPTILLV